jgi:hypothetical protein
MASTHRESALPTQVEKEKTLAVVNMRHVLHLITTMIMLWGASTLTSLEFLYG